MKLSFLRLFVILLIFPPFGLIRDVKASRPMWPRGQIIRPRPHRSWPRGLEI